MAQSNMPKHPVVSVGCFIFNDEGKLLLLKSALKFAGQWVIPGGKVDYFEKIETALRRETHEETGLKIGHVEFLGFEEHLFDTGFYEGLHSIFFKYAARLKTPQDVIIDAESSDYRWVSAEELSSLDLHSVTVQMLKKTVFPKDWLQ